MAANRRTVVVTLENREDGGLRAYSRDLPQLRLAGKDAGEVAARVVPEIASLCGQPLTVVTVKLEDRPDGGLRAYSDDLPGLMLSGRNRTDVAAKIAPAIEALFAYCGYSRVTVRPARPVGEVLALQKADLGDQRMQQPGEEQFVVALG